MNASISTLLTDFAAAAEKDFPALKNRLLMYDVTSELLIGPDNPEWQHYCQIKSLQDAVSGGRRTHGLSERKMGMNIIYLFNREEMEPLQIIDILHHELGHLVGPGGMFTDHGDIFSECVAQTFSELRLIQQGHTDELAKKVFMHAYTTVFNGYTDAPEVFVLQELLGLSQRHDLTKLTPVQTANLAYRLSLRFTPPDDLTPAIAKIFSPIETAEDGTSMSTCADIMLADHGKLTGQAFQVAKNVIMPFLDRDVHLLKALVPDDVLDSLFFTGPAWDDIRAKIKERPIPSPSPIDDLELLGRFDKNPDVIIDPKHYESSENQAYIKAMRDAYARPKKAAGPTL